MSNREVYQEIHAAVVTIGRMIRRFDNVTQSDQEQLMEAESRLETMLGSPVIAAAISDALVDLMYENAATSGSPANRRR